MSPKEDRIREAFRRRFGAEPAFIGSAPGRVNLMGEHTDYMGGLVLPVAIDREVLFAVRAAPGGTVRGYSLDFSEEVSFPAGQYDQAHACGWLRYVLGVLREVAKRRPPGAFDFCVIGDVPMGSGLSSSAAMELAVLTAVRGLTGIDLDKPEAALLCQRAENDFVGVKCGIMDQFISSAGLRDHALMINCRDLSWEAIPALTPGHAWLAIDSGKRRGLVDSEYNVRFAQCHAGLRFLQTVFPEREITNVRDVSWEEFLGLREKMDPVIFKRIRHVLSENLRVLQTAEALKAGDLEVIGECLYASHASLRDDFEVSCPELDALVEIAAGVPGTVGARLTGAGFGGCVLALVAETAVDAVGAAIAEDYPRRFPGRNLRAELLPIRISDGARLLEAARPARALHGN